MRQDNSRILPEAAAPFDIKVFVRKIKTFRKPASLIKTPDGDAQGRNGFRGYIFKFQLRDKKACVKIKRERGISLKKIIGVSP